MVILLQQQRKMNTSGIVFELTILKQTYFSFLNSKISSLREAKVFAREGAHIGFQVLLFLSWGVGAQNVDM